MKDYYHILNVSRSAHAYEIKKAYRKLAKRYHPDTSTIANAHSYFTEINEAYGVLSDPGKKAAYDAREHYGQQKIYRPAPASPTQKARKMREHIMRIKKQQSEQQRVHYKKYKYRSKLVLFVVLFFVLSIFVDYVSSPITITETVLWRGGKVHTESCHFPMQPKLFQKAVRKGRPVTVQKTPLYHMNKKIYFKEANRTLALSPEYGIYNAFVFFPILILIGSAMALLSKNDYFFAYTMSIVVSITSLIMVALMFLSN